MRYVYLDVLVAINLVMNLIILFLTSWLAQVPARLGRLLLGAAVGTAYAVYLVLTPSTLGVGWVAKVLFSVLILAATFVPASPVRFLRAAGYFYLLSFTLGGAALAVYYLGQGPAVETSGPLPGIPWWTLLLGLAVTVPAARLAWLYLSRRRWQKEVQAKLTIRWGSREAELKAILDSGNLLVDPLTGAPVVVAEAAALSFLVSPRLLAALKEGLDLDRLSQVLAAEPEAHRFRIIPFDSLGQTNSLLLAFRPDQVGVTYAGRKTKIPRAVVGLALQRLSPEGAYQALVNPQVLAPYLDEA
ncbi:sigma-E processing peptidase SpoIIGA [Gelria sp. Kuro-4]|uniref:sigma-E processing peptidase SpoIIGA n=1 Tax=Gelria sp. Kuro-4 TaxID=2796927 RepID=UPI001BEFE4CB|nr:sigma-E processing peptidase SpoIIGA [Gelria sp. Kuro-4]BCV24708.1 sporulation sigma-E factor-processing peptidase [Gelria sp. Kuro-4]